MNLPSVKRMIDVLGVTREQAKQIRAVMEGPRVPVLTRMERIDSILGTYGVEYIRHGQNERSPGIYYCNTGDTYGATVLKVNGAFKLGAWGDIVERGDYE